LCGLSILYGPLHLYNKRVRPTENEPQRQGISYLEREREGVTREREGWPGWAGQQAGIFKVRLSLGEIKGRDKDTERKRDI